MKTLFLLRHAKSSKDDPFIDDFDRPLNDRGKADAKLIGEFISREQLTFDATISSPAKRAHQTAKKVLSAAKLDLAIEFHEGIYEAGVHRLFEIVREINDERVSVLLVGHNPGFEELLHLLTGESNALPTATFARIDFLTERWRHIRPRGGILRTFVTPKHLKEQLKI